MKTCKNLFERIASFDTLLEGKDFFGRGFSEGVRPEVLRGGSWNNNQENARCANRNRNNPNNRNNNVGFRCSRT